MLRAVSRRVRGRLILLVACMAVRALTGLAVPALLAASVDAALRHSGTGRPAAELAVVLAVGGVCEIAAGLLGASAAARGGVWLRMRLTDRVLALGPRSRTPHGETVIRLTQAASQAAELPVAMAQWGVSALGSAAAFALLWFTDWRVGLAFALGVPVAVVLARRFVGDAAEAQGRYLAAQAGIATRLIAALDGARTIRASGTLRAETDRVLEPLADVSSAGHDLWRLQRGMVWRFGLLLPAVEVLVLGVAGTAVASGRLAPGQLLAVAGYLAIASQAVEQIDTLFRLAQARAGADRLAATLAEEPPVAGTARAPEGGGAVSLRGVTVRRGEDTVLDGLDLELPTGASVALVGRSGSGKSVLAGLIGRLTDPDEGTVLIDGVPVRDLALDEVRRLVSYAFERPVLLGATVYDAIAFGRAPDGANPAGVRTTAGHSARDAGSGAAEGAESGFSRAEVVRAARAARADGFIRLLPAGYDTALDAAPLSGGERQRVGLARALVKPARVFVLDDATSGLDTLTEVQVTRAVTRLLSGRTRLVVAHRPTTAARCDSVAWLDGGRIRAVGTHRDLWRRPDYRAVFSTGAADAGQEEPGATPAAPAGTAEVGADPPGKVRPVSAPAPSACIAGPPTAAGSRSASARTSVSATTPTGLPHTGTSATGCCCGEDPCPARS